MIVAEKIQPKKNGVFIYFHLCFLIAYLKGVHRRVRRITVQLLLGHHQLSLWVHAEGSGGELPGVGWGVILGSLV